MKITIDLTPRLKDTSIVPSHILYRGKQIATHGVGPKGDWVVIDLPLDMAATEALEAIEHSLGVKGAVGEPKESVAPPPVPAVTPPAVTPPPTTPPQVPVVEAKVAAAAEATQTPSNIFEDIDFEINHMLSKLDFSAQVSEPNVSVNPSDPLLDTKVPDGLLIWDSIFAKRPPVLNFQQWVKTSESEKFVYLPNDGTKSLEESEEVASNAYYTEVLVNAYHLLCERQNCNPKVLLADGTEIYALKVKPSDGTQHTCVGEVSARLANSTLMGFDDSIYAKEFIECICDLGPESFEKEQVRKRVLAKVESILMGRTSHTYNQRFIHALYELFADEETEVPWQAHRIQVAQSVMGILRQMVVEGLILEDNRAMFIARLRSLGYSEFEKEIGAFFDDAKRGKV
jgi:hypothetical protein